MTLFAHAASLPGGIPIRSAENWPCSSAMKTSLKSASIGERLFGSPQSIHLKKPLWPRSPPSGGPGIGCSRTSVFWMVQRFVWPSIVVSMLRALKAEKHPSKRIVDHAAVQVVVLDTVVANVREPHVLDEEAACPAAWPDPVADVVHADAVDGE